MSAGRLLAKVRPPVTEGNLFAWGGNGFGTFGDGNQDNQASSPVQIGSLADWSRMSVFWVSLALRAGRLYGWSKYNGVGAVGNGTRDQIFSPVQVGAATDWTYVATYGVYSGGYDSSWSAGIRGGKLFTWGYNVEGELGLGNVTSRSSPVQVGAATDWTCVAAGNYFMLGIRGGALFSWGYGAQGQLGWGAGDEHQSSSPVQVGSATDWTLVSSNGLASFGIRGGKLFAWGADTQGILGLGGIGGTSSPVQVGSATDWTHIHGGRSTCGIRGGKLFAWGDNSYYQLGLGDATARNSPVQVGAATDWTHAAVSGAADWPVMAGIRGGKLFAWGANGVGGVGDGTRTTRSSPVQIGSSTNWIHVAVGNSSTHGMRA